MNQLSAENCQKARQNRFQDFHQAYFEVSNAEISYLNSVEIPTNALSLKVKLLATNQYSDYGG